ncbi:unnamed protein product, partial [Onchocerca ochengi]
VTSKEELVEKAFPNIQINYKNHDWLSVRAILDAKIKDVDDLNNFIQSNIQSEMVTYRSFHTVVEADKAPKHCNGTRLAVKKLMSNAIEASVLIGPYKDEDVLIPGIPMIPTDMRFQFKKLQFPIRLVFAFTTNKAQGQSLELCGLDLETDCFSHGQIYVACCSVGKPDSL